MLTKKNRLVVTAVACLSAAIFITGCRRDDPPATVQRWEIPVKTTYQVPALAGRSEDGYATLTLAADNSLEYTLYINNLSSNDTLTDAHIHFGNAASNGSVVIDLKPDFKARYTTTGIVFNLRQGQIDTLRNKPVYINIHSKKAGSGLVRGQIDKQITFAADVALSGNNEVPPVTTTASGLCILRLTSDKVLYSKVTVDNLETADALTAAHIHSGAAGANGDVQVSLCGSAADFDILKISAPLSDALVQSLKNNPLYVNAHSTLHGSGLIRGQIR